MGLEISKCYTCCSYHLISSKLYGGIGYHGGKLAITFLDFELIFKVLWNFEN